MVKALHTHRAEWLCTDSRGNMRAASGRCARGTVLLSLDFLCKAALTNHPH
jgi:hypothetical protein